MRIHTAVAAGAGTLLTVFALSACDPTSVTATVNPSKSSANITVNSGGSDSSPSSSSGSGSSGGSNNGSGTSTGSTSNSAGGSGNSGAVASAACQASNLSITSANGQTENGTSSVIITLTNQGSSSCEFQGFAGVNINTGGGAVEVPRNGAKWNTITVSPGSSSTFAIWYESETPSSQKGNNVVNLTVTPPNETHSVTVSWPGSGLTTGNGGQSLWIDPVGETAPDALGTANG